MNYHQQKNTEGGYVIVTIIVFIGIMVIVLGSLTSFVFSQTRLGNIREAKEEALQIAEAGLDYYKWYLAHYPDDLTHGTGDSGPYQIDFSDPETGVVGQYELDITGNNACGSPTSILIESTGWTQDYPNRDRTVYGKYARPSVAEYAYILNSNVWAGDDREISGRYHSNGGIRFDGSNDSTVTSAVETWECTDSFGCSPGGETKDGVFGTTGNGTESLWDFPTLSIDFTGITVDLVSAKQAAQTDGIYLDKISGQNERRGYRLEFNGDGTVDIWRVNGTGYFWGFHSDTRTWERDYHRINGENFMGTFDVPSSCSVIFSEEKLWISGQVDGKVTVAVADVDDGNYSPEAVLNGDITYTDYSGNSGLTLVAEGSVVVPLVSPNIMTLNGIFIAQNGYFGRNHYRSAYTPSSYWSYITQDELHINGTIVSNGRVGTQWTNGGSTVSGYENRFSSYDRQLATDPPPFTPYTSDEFEFVEWGERE